MEPELTVYGTTWCGDCLRTRRVLDRENISFKFINIECDPDGRAYVASVNHGNLSVPTIVFPDGSLLVEPHERELLEHLTAVQIA